MNKHSNIKAAIAYDDLREWLSAAEAVVGRNVVT